MAAISFLNPAPLLYNFEHEPAATELRTRYNVHYTTPARCAAQLYAGEADLGLIPIAQLNASLRVVPGCTIASLREVRSILLLLRTGAADTQDDALRAVRSIAADSASRSSAAYVRTILHHFYGVDPAVEERAADPLAMLGEGHDAALVIGDPALLARENRPAIDAAMASNDRKLLWLDVAELWHRHTGLPWVAAVWGARPDTLRATGTSETRLIDDLLGSRDAGLAHTEDLAAEWAGRLPLSAATIRRYLTDNIHYRLDEPCLGAIRTFRELAAAAGVLPPLPVLPLLQG